MGFTTRNAIHATKLPGSNPSNSQPRGSKRAGDGDTARHAVRATERSISSPAKRNPGRSKCARDDDSTWNAVRATWHAICPGRSRHAVHTVECPGTTSAGATWHAVWPGGEGMQYMQPDVQFQPLQLYT